MADEENTEFISFGNITNILACLPVKSLLRFMCICKECNSIISDTGFQRSHIWRSTMNPSMNHHHLLVPTRSDGVMTCSLKSILNNDPLITPQYCLDDTWTHSPNQYDVLATCDGLVCLFRNEHEHKHLLFWNPSTRLVSKKSSLLHQIVKEEHCIGHGFGHDYVSGKYKVLFIFPRDTGHQELDNWRSDTHIYSSGDDTWKTINNSYYLGRTTMKEGKLVENCLNWVTNIASDHSPGFEEWTIIYFDMSKDVFWRMSLPDFGDHKPRDPIQAVLKGQLSVFYVVDEKLVVWVMKKYGVIESWIKFMVIPWGETQINLEGGVPWFELVCMLDNDRLMFTAEDYPIVISAVYDTKNNSLEFPNIHSDKRWNSVHFYMESLISPCITNGSEESA